MIQQVLTGRRWPKTGENEFLRKAVRKHEVFWVRECAVVDKTERWFISVCDCDCESLVDLAWRHDEYVFTCFIWTAERVCRSTTRVKYKDLVSLI